MLEMHLKAIVKELRNRKQIKAKRIYKGNSLKHEVLTHLDGTFRHYLTFAIIPKSDVLLGHHRGKAGEPSVITGHVLRATGINEPRVLQASDLLNKKETKDEQMSQH